MDADVAEGLADMIDHDRLAPSIKLRCDPMLTRALSAVACLLITSFSVAQVIVDSNPGAWHAYNGHIYRLTESPSTWETALDSARRYGGDLATVEDRGEHDWLWTTFGGAGDLWIGLNDRDEEGTFAWSSGHTGSSAGAWRPGEPNGGAAENCVEMASWASGLWNDQDGQSLNFGIVEVPVSRVYPDPQSGVDATPAHGWCRVIGSFAVQRGSSEPPLITIWKPMTLVGGRYNGAGARQPVIDIATSGTVALMDIDIVGGVDDLMMPHHAAVRAVTDRLYIIDSYIEGTEGNGITGGDCCTGTPTNSALEASVEIAYLIRSVFIASDPDPWGRGCVMPSGSCAVSVNSVVVAVESSFQGGDGGANAWWDCGAAAPPGGDGLRAMEVYHVNCRFRPGMGGSLYLDRGMGDCNTFCHSGSPGQPISAARVHDLGGSRLLSANSPLYRGESSTIHYRSSSWPMALIIAEPDLPSVFVNWTIHFNLSSIFAGLYLAPGTSELHLDVPTEPALIGAPLCFQIFDGVEISAPLIDIIR